MMSGNKIYRCSVCGKVVEVLHDADGTLVCCGQDMILMGANSIDAAIEKHVPVVEIDDTGVTVKVGSVPHPMEDSHYIMWIELLYDGISEKKFLMPGDEPEARFEVKADNVKARAYCNLHGLWEN